VESRYGPLPKHVAQEPDLLALLLPYLRADIIAHETYGYTEEEPLDCPITALGGLQDRTALSDEVEAWREETSASFSSSFFPGDHFFINSMRLQVLRLIADALQNGGAAQPGD